MAITVLICDDEPAQRFMLREFFESKGCQVLEAEDGADAFHKANANRPSIIILDVNMPNIEGIPAANVMGELPEMADIPVIIYSGEDEERVKRFLNFGPKRRFMPKPGDLAKMWEWVEEMTPGS
jgi:two-component system chemotaxis response regulator CheY